MEAPSSTYKQLVEKDRRLLWHPFTQVKTAHSCIPIVRGEGAYIYDADQNRYLDGISSWWVNLHGHAHPYIAKKIKAQLDSLEHVIFAGFTHSPAIELAERLLAILPGSPSKIFYTDNGSTAVEAALKMAFQYGYNLNEQTKKTKALAFQHSYHGDTFGAMSAAGKNALHKPFWKYLFEIESIEPPLLGKESDSLAQFERAAKKGDVACFIFEPLVLGVGGMQIYPPQGLDAMLELCRQYGIISIADEVMTGFGRTGSLFACDQLSQKPDIMCLSKGLTGGFLPFGAVACSEHIFQGFTSEKLEHAFLHGHSFAGNPLACASAIASLDLLAEEACRTQIGAIARCHQKFVQAWKHHPKLKRCESLGTILAVEYASDGISYFYAKRNQLCQYFLQNHILLRPFGNVLHVIPPYCITEEELAFIYAHIIRTLEEI